MSTEPTFGRTVYQLSWLTREGDAQTDPLARYSLSESMRHARAHWSGGRMLRMTIRALSRDDIGRAGAGVLVWSNGALLTPDAQQCATACTIAGDIISAQSAQHVGAITITGAGIAFAITDWDGTRYTVSVQTDAQTDADTARALDLISSAHAVVRECADCNDQSYVFASDALSVAHAVMHGGSL